MIRTFIAIELPEAFRTEALRLTRELKRAGADVKWARPEGIHLTLKFLGNASEEAIPPLAADVGAAVAGFGELNLTASGTGLFPDEKRPRVVWVGLTGDLLRLIELQQIIERTAAGHGFEPENRPFHPHLTVGRIKSPKGARSLVDELKKQTTNPLDFSAREVIIFKSDLKPTGAEYTALHRLPLT